MKFVGNKVTKTKSEKMEHIELISWIAVRNWFTLKINDYSIHLCPL
jgi:hypothetical protein